MTDWFRTKGYTPCNTAKTIWILKGPSGIIVHIVYVDDFLHFYSNRVLYEEFQVEFSNLFQSKSGEVSWYLGNNISKVGGHMMLDQKEYINNMLEKCGMNDLNVTTPMAEHLTKATPTKTKLGPKQHAAYCSLIGCLIYVAVWSRQDILVCCVGAHWQAAKYLLCYLHGTSNVCLSYSAGLKCDNVLWGYWGRRR